MINSNLKLIFFFGSQSCDALFQILGIDAFFVGWQWSGLRFRRDLSPVAAAAPIAGLIDVERVIGHAAHDVQAHRTDHDRRYDRGDDVPGQEIRF